MSTQIYGIRGVGNWSHPDERPKSYDDVMFKYQPEMAPLTGLSTRLGIDMVSDMEFTCFEEDVPVSQVLVSGSHNDSVTTIALKTTGDAGAEPAKILREGDVLRCARTGEVFWVSVEPASPWTSVVVATRATLGGTAYALVDADVLEIMAPAAAEGSEAGEALSDTPDTIQNYCQDIEEVAEVSDWAEEMEIRPKAEKAFAREKRRALERFKLKWEKTLFFGLKKSTTKGGKRVYFTNGIVNQIPSANRFDDSSTGTSMDRVMEVFANLRNRGQGSETRWGFAGTTALRYLTNLIRKETVANWSVGEMLDRKTTYGLRVFEIEGPTMRLQLIHTPILALNTYDSAKVVIVDPKYIRLVRMGRKGGVHFDDDIAKDNGYRGRKGRWRAIQGVKLTCSKLHALWTVGSYAP